MSSLDPLIGCSFTIKDIFQLKRCHLQTEETMSFKERLAIFNSVRERKMVVHSLFEPSNWPATLKSKWVLFGMMFQSVKVKGLN